MNIFVAVLREHFDYTRWATTRLLKQVALLPEEHLMRDFGTADRSILQTLAHIYLADRIWLGRVEHSAGPFGNAAEYRLADLESAWPLLHHRWAELLNHATDNSADEPVTYRDLKNREWRQPLWQVLLHTVNHGTHHRGQVVGFLRAMGYVPEPLDLIACYRERQSG